MQRLTRRTVNRSSVEAYWSIVPSTYGTVHVHVHMYCGSAAVTLKKLLCARLEKLRFRRPPTDVAIKKSLELVHR
jgi:hypothetical protein